MCTLEITHVDLECGRRSSTVGGATSYEEEEEEGGSDCFSDISDQFYSIADGDVGCAPEGSESTKGVDLENNAERDCRICHVRLQVCSSSPAGSGPVIELGCSCKDDLAAAHKDCAETWFKIKGNKTCEICHSVARNVVCPNDTEAAQQATESDNIVSASATETQESLKRRRFLKLLLACMVFAWVVSWLVQFLSRV